MKNSKFKTKKKQYQVLSFFALELTQWQKLFPYASAKKRVSYNVPRPVLELIDLLRLYHFSWLSLLFKTVFDAWVTASLIWPGCLTSDERWTACWRIILQPGRLRGSGTGYTSNAAATASEWMIRQLSTFHFRGQKDKKQTSLTVWPLYLTKLQFPTFPQNKSLIVKEVASSKGEYWPVLVLQKAYDFQTSALVYTIKQAL